MAAAATAQAIARSRILAASTSLRSGSSCLLSFSPRIATSGERITAPATTAPNSDPRPTSSTPAINRYPRARNSCSRAAWHFQRGFFAARDISGPSAALDAFFQAGGLALELAQIVQLRAAHFAGAYEIDVIDQSRIEWENSFHTLSEADLADRYGLSHARVLAGDHGSFE